MSPPVVIWPSSLTLCTKLPWGEGEHAGRANSFLGGGGGDPDPWGALPQCFRTASEEVFGWAFGTCCGGHAEQKKRQQETPVSGYWQFAIIWWGWGKAHTDSPYTLAWLGRIGQFSFLVGQLG